MDMDFVGAFELEYGRMIDFSRIILSFTIHTQYIRIQKQYLKYTGENNQ